MVTELGEKTNGVENEITIHICFRLLGLVIFTEPSLEAVLYRSIKIHYTYLLSIEDKTN